MKITNPCGAITRKKKYGQLLGGFRGGFKVQ